MITNGKFPNTTGWSCSGSSGCSLSVVSDTSCPTGCLKLNSGSTVSSNVFSLELQQQYELSFTIKCIGPIESKIKLFVRQKTSISSVWSDIVICTKELFTYNYLFTPIESFSISSMILYFSLVSPLDSIPLLVDNVSLRKVSGKLII